MVRITDISTSERPSSFWIVGAAIVIAARSSVMTKVMGAISNETIPHRKLPILFGILTAPKIINDALLWNHCYRCGPANRFPFVIVLPQAEGRGADRKSTRL